jgi:hypothetical protein
MILEAEQRRSRGAAEGQEIGQQKAIAELVGRLFARRVGRRPTTEEEARSWSERARDRSGRGRG